MKLICRIVLIVALLAPGAGVSVAAQEPQGSPEVPEQQGEFVPAGSLPQREQMPAAPLLIGAYAFVLLALFGYVISVSRRVGSVKSDIARLESELKRGTRA